jgi:4-hydroxy-tetrahydrodipicolinate reductase
LFLKAGNVKRKMNKQFVFISGLPGKMATLVTERIIREKEFGYWIMSLTGENQPKQVSIGENKCFSLRSPQEHEEILSQLDPKDTIIVDYTQPEAVNRNVELYYKYGLNFVMGTTGGDRKALEERVKNSDICAVIAPNMAAPIVALQGFWEGFANDNPNAFKGYLLEIEESHQATKKDPSGTAFAFSKSFAKLGIAGMPYDSKDADAIKAISPKPLVDLFGNSFKMIRNPEEQKRIGVPYQFLSGHGWHKYTIRAPEEYEGNLVKAKENLNFFFHNHPVFSDYTKDSSNSGITLLSSDNTVFLESSYQDDRNLTFIHDINGRNIYVDGTMQALRFLSGKIKTRQKGFYTMSDVIAVGMA